jgi:hypothetical protein
VTVTATATMGHPWPSLLLRCLCVMGRPWASLLPQRVMSILLGWWFQQLSHRPPPLPTTLTSVPPEMHTVYKTRRSAASSEALTATVEDGMPPSWKTVGGVAMTLPDRKMACVVAKKPDGYSLSWEEDDEDGFPFDVDFSDTLGWMRSEEKAYDDKQKRKAEERAEEDNKRRAAEGYSPAFIIDIGGVPLERVESEHQLAVAAAAAAAAVAAATAAGAGAAWGCGCGWGYCFGCCCDGCCGNRTMWRV